jgi:hypothetical protein
VLSHSSFWQAWLFRRMLKGIVAIIAITGTIVITGARF